MQENGKGVSPFELVNRVEERREERIAANIVDSCWKMLKDDSNKDFTSVPGWAREIPGCDWVDAGIIAVVFRDDRKNPEHTFYKSYSSIGKVLGGLDKATVQRHAKKLEALGVLRKTARKGAQGAYCWHLNAPKIVELIGWSDRR